MTFDFPDYTNRVFSNAESSEQAKADCTGTKKTITWSQETKWAMMYNNGPYAVHVATGTSVTTDSFLVPSRAYLMIPVSHSKISFICASGETATVYLWGFW